MDKDKVRAFSEKVFAHMGGAMIAGMGYLGTKTGLFRAMAGQGLMGLDDVVGATGLHSRYVEEWLKGMTCGGYLQYDPVSQKYCLPDEHAFLLASDETDHFMGGLFCLAPILLRFAPQIAAAFEKGGGVRFADVGEDGVTAFDLINRGKYEHRFTSYWLRTMPGVIARLEEGGRVLDVGCGAGRVCMAIAKEFPKADVTGLDPDEESVKQARDAAATAGLANHIRFLAATTDDLDAIESFDLITACDCIHDFASPHATLKKLHTLLKPEGVLFVIEPKVADRLEDNVNPIATMFYGFSLFHCMTQSLAAGGPGLGTCLGPERTEKLVREAGFRRFEKLDIKSPVNLFYAAQP